MLDDDALPGTSDWRLLLPKVKGRLPNGVPLTRTDPGGSFEARILILGVYPAAAGTGQTVVGGTKLNLPISVEKESFEPASKSGAELDRNYLHPVGLTRHDVLITDMVPYYFANTTPGPNGRSMADNVRLFEKESKRMTGIDARPASSDLVALAHTMPGNRNRLREYVGRSRPKLLLTLGTEAAAFARGEPFEAVKRHRDELFYSEPETMEFLGTRLHVVHLVHPHLFIRRDETWMRRHREWSGRAGRKVVEACLAG